MTLHLHASAGCHVHVCKVIVSVYIYILCVLIASLLQGMSLSEHALHTGVIRKVRTE